jgi:hypothetical protein
VVARVSNYAFPPNRLAQIGNDVRAAVHADPRGYDPCLVAAFLGVERESGRSVAVTVATDAEGLRQSPSEPRDAEPAQVAQHDVEQAYVADSDAFEAGTTPRLHLSPGTAWQAPEQDPDDLVYAAFALARGTRGGTLLVAFAEWPAWTRRIRRSADVYDVEYFMVRHGSQVG